MPNERENVTYPASSSVADNACRLYSDARLLLRKGRWPSASAMAILAIEEVGKFHIYSWRLVDGYAPKGRAFPPRHSDKQAAFSAPFVAHVQRRAMVAACKSIASKHDWDAARGADDWEKCQDFLVEGYAVSQNGETPEIRENAVEILNIIAKTVDLSVSNDPLACLMQLADSNEIDKVKQAGLYLDVGPDGTVRSDPKKINKEEAKFWVCIARVAIVSLQSLERADKAARWFGRRYRVVAPMLAQTVAPTSEDWKRMFEARRLMGAGPQSDQRSGRKNKN